MVVGVVDVDDVAVVVDVDADVATYVVDFLGFLIYWLIYLDF